MSRLYLLSALPKLQLVRRLYCPQPHHQSSKARPFSAALFSVKSQQRSLFDELFPEESPNDLRSDVRSQINDEFTPRLHLPDVECIDEGVKVESSEHGPSRISTAASAFRLWDLAILVLSRASKSLLDGDFRRIAPQGRHIDDWKGPGDILKVIPVRDPATLEQNGRYYILFPNPACARAYQNQALRISRLARSHTPSSLASRIIPFRSIDRAEGEDLSRLCDYALSPSSSPLHLRTLPAPFHASVKHVLNSRGYPQIMEPVEKTNRAVLFWTNGIHLTTHQLKQAIEQDGYTRGMVWALDKKEDNVQKLDSSKYGDSLLESLPRGFEATYRQRVLPRWIISFENEAEARRFVRSWHCRVMPVEVDEASDAPEASCQVLW